MKKYPSIDMHSIAYQAVAEHGFYEIFAKPVVKDVEQVEEITDYKEQTPLLRDLRQMMWSSIDNHDSKDLDQLEFCERAQNLEIRVMVAIADVDIYVKKGSKVDKHAGHNGTSVYTGIDIFPMLPDKLSSNLTSLIEHQDRPAIIIEFFVRKDGSVRCGDIYRGLVNNKAKLVYEPLGEWLMNEGPIPPAVENMPGLKEQILLQNEAAQRLHEFRMENGALELETIEASPVIVNDEIVDLLLKKKNPARYIIENFMIAANGTMVKYLDKKGAPYIQRIVQTPERWEKIRAVAEELGETLPLDPDSLALSQFLAKQRQVRPDTFPDLSLTIVKLMGRGEYMATMANAAKIGHFGLAVLDYTHSTAPNRRYVDLIIQRLLKAVLADGPSPYNKGELDQIAHWCTERDTASKKVERFMRKVTGAMLLRDRVGETFDAIVTGVTDKGTYVRLEAPAPPVEGRVVRGERGMDVGEKVRVRLMRMFIEKGYIDFERAVGG